MSTRHTVAGVDLSLTGLALVVIPSDWNHDFNRVLRCSLGTESGVPVVERMRSLSCDAAAWLEWARVTHVYIERPMVARKMYNLDQVFRLCGMVELRVLELSGICCEWAPLMAARKLIAGGLPRSGQKDFVRQVVSGITDVFGDGDQVDAFVAANYGLSELGYPCVSVAVAA